MVPEFENEAAADPPLLEAMVFPAALPTGPEMGLQVVVPPTEDGRFKYCDAWATVIVPSIMAPNGSVLNREGPRRILTTRSCTLGLVADDELLRLQKLSCWLPKMPLKKRKKLTDNGLWLI